MKSQQSGFTLIELIMVIVILGILSAFALPKFANLSKDAEKATIEGARAAVKSASAIVHAKALVTNKTGATGDFRIEGNTLVRTVYGYAAATHICAAAGLGTDFRCTTAGSVTTIQKATGNLDVGDYCFKYTQSASATGSPVITTVNTVATARQCP